VCVSTTLRLHRESVYYVEADNQYSIRRKHKRGKRKNIRSRYSTLGYSQTRGRPSLPIFHDADRDGEIACGAVRIDASAMSKSQRSRWTLRRSCEPYNALKFKYAVQRAGPRYVNNFTATRFSRAGTPLSAFFLYLFPRSRKRVY